MIHVDTGKDVVEELRHMQQNVAGYKNAHEVLDRAIAEIQYLRGMAGAVTQGESLDEIRRRARAQIDMAIG